MALAGRAQEIGRHLGPRGGRRTLFPNSGQPELLATREGPILHVATSGIHSDSRRGPVLAAAGCAGHGLLPPAVQGQDGRIFVFGHVGGDDAYGKSDQSIVMDSFRIIPK